MAKHLFLVGYRGSGKSSVGRRLGVLLKMPAVDSDDCVESGAGKSIRAIFSEDGESFFRDLETQAIQLITERAESTVVSLGGGAILCEKNRELLKKHGSVVWLQVSIDEIARRLAEDTMTQARRPALTPLAAIDEIKRLLEIREPIYRAVADCSVQTDHRAVDDIASEIEKWYLDSTDSETRTLDRK